MSVGGEIPVVVDRTGRGDDASPRPGVWLVSINRAAARNAVDGPTAAALLAVFRSVALELAAEYLTRARAGRVLMRQTRCEQGV